MSQYERLIQKLDDFIKKYYKNQIIKGALLTLLILVSYFTVLAMLEYFGNFSVPVRTVLFFASLSLASVVLIYYVVLPVMKFAKIGPVISHRQAATIISRHFSHVEDKLLNTLELAAKGQSGGSSYELVMASIEQRARSLESLPFPSAINTRDNGKYAKILGGVLGMVTLIYFFFPSILTEGTGRLVNYQTHFQPPAPFAFNLLTDSLVVEKGGDFEVELQITGSYVPAEVRVEYGGNAFVMERRGNSRFAYQFKSINNSIDIRFSAEQYQSADYKIKVLPTPLILNFSLKVDVPEYTGERDRVLENVGDLTVPVGSRITWHFDTRDLDSLWFFFSDSTTLSGPLHEGGIELERRAMQSLRYDVSVANRHFTREKVVSYKLNVIPDVHPTIDLRMVRDSLRPSVFYFNGRITDDYGFSRLAFRYYQADKPQDIKSVALQMSPAQTAQQFYHAVDFSQLDPQGNGDLRYFFEVWDNDQVNGAKSARSQEFDFTVPSSAELNEQAQQSNSNIREKLQQSQTLVQEIQNSISDLQQNVINQNTSSWEQSATLNEILKKQQQLEELLEEIAEENEQRDELMQAFDEQTQELLEKQKQLQEMMDNLLTDEMKEMMERIRELQEQFDPQKLNDLSQEMEMSFENFSNQLDRNMEMLERYEMEQRMEQLSQDLQQLSEEQERLAEMTEEEELPQQDLEQMQQEQQERFEQLMEEYEQTQEMNEELSQPMDLQEFQEQREQIEQEFQEGQENLQQNKNNKASENQQNNSQNLQQLSEQMQQMMSQNIQQQQGENAETLRQILDNLVRFSFDQEDLMKSIEPLASSDPKYVEAIDRQTTLENNFKVINDSLVALSKRAPEVSSYVNELLLKIQRDIKGAQRELDSRNKPQALMRQQFIMTSANDLALLLAESLENMESSASSSGSGSGKPNPKPGEGSGGEIGEMRDMQQRLQDQMQQMLQMLEQGQMPGGQQMNQQLGEMMRQQEMYNQMMRQLMQNGGVGDQARELMEEAQDMIEQNENDIINRQITPETLFRQQQILTRLLEAQESEEKREFSEQRQAERPQEHPLSNPEEIFQELGEGDIFRENLDFNSLKFHNYYKEMYKEYMLNLNQ